MSLDDGESLNVNEADPRVKDGKAPVRYLTIENWEGKPLPTHGGAGGGDQQR
jgi:hypothetical protein